MSFRIDKCRLQLQTIAILLSYLTVVQLFMNSRVIMYPMFSKYNPPLVPVPSVELHFWLYSVVAARVGNRLNHKLEHKNDFTDILHAAPSTLACRRGHEVLHINATSTRDALNNKIKNEAKLKTLAFGFKEGLHDAANSSAPAEVHECRLTPRR